MKRFAAILGAGLLAVSACGPTQPSGPATQGETPLAGGRIVESAISDVKTFQPVISTDTASSTAWGYAYIGLLRSNPDTGDLEGGLAEKFALSSDGLTVTYTLRDGLKWSDGEPFTMEDYKYTVEAVARSARTVRKSTIQDIVGYADYKDGKTDSMAGLVVKDGGKAIDIKLSKAFCPALRNLSSAAAGGILPRHHFVKYWDNRSTDTKKNIDDNPLNMAPPASIGPFVFKEFRPGVQTSYTANPNYYRGKPLVDEWILKVYADQSAVKAALLTGEVHFAGAAAGDVEELQNAGKDTLNFNRIRGVSSYNFIGWNAKSAKAPWLASKDVRQALWYGLNVKTIVDKVVLGYGHQVFAHTPQASWAYSAEGLNQYGFDQAKAKQLLEKAGAKMGGDGFYRWTNGAVMQMRIETNQGNKVRETIVEIAQEQYKAIGIKIDPLLESFPALLERTEPGTDYEGFVIGWSLGLDPDMYAIWHSSQQGKGQFNNVFFTSPEADAAMVSGRNGPDCSAAARKTNYAKVNKILNEEAPYTFLYTGDSLVFSNKSLRAFEPKQYSTQSGWNIEKWWIKR
ncbi:MAG TPA: ABC transporter substrate-binding protein [Candidatus Limnocylindria bacterium]|nr:ABC transporter substrate-binding protein [Candidatus Limnocylindria bacterium]